MSKTSTFRPVPLALSLLVATFSALVALAVSGGHEAMAHGNTDQRASMQANMAASRWSADPLRIRARVRANLRHRSAERASHRPASGQDRILRPAPRCECERPRANEKSRVRPAAAVALRASLQVERALAHAPHKTRTNPSGDAPQHRGPPSRSGDGARMRDIRPRGEAVDSATIRPESSGTSDRFSGRGTQVQMWEPGSNNSL